MPNARILYCDDEPALRDIVADQLKESGFDVDTAADGIEGIERLQKEPGYDVLLLDINMPGKSGFDVLKFVRENGLKCRTIMLTGQVGFSKGMESMKLGAQGYVTKDALELQADGEIEKSDLNIDYLLMTINRVLAGG